MTRTGPSLKLQMLPNPTSTLELKVAAPADFEAVATLFEALHQLNASLDPRFALADNWRQLLHSHFQRTCTAAGALWLLAWSDHAWTPAQNGCNGAEPSKAIGLLIMEAHQDSPLFKHRRWAELVALYVDPAYRGGGLAERMVAYGRTWTAEHGFDRVQLYVTSGNEPAKAFYHRCGFRPAQEIWRLGVTPGEPVDLPADPSHSEKGGCGADFLESGHHHLAMEIETERESENEDR